jgi:hypothetical protein
VFDQETRSFIRYIAPSVVFGVATLLEDHVSHVLYPFVYALKIAAVTGCLLVVRVTLRDIRPSMGVLLPAIVVGLAVFAEWILIDRWLPYPHLGSRAAFNPLASLHDPLRRTAFLAVRFYGLVLVVPVMEELFLRSFVLRFVTDPDFTRVPFGVYSWTAFWTVAGLSALSHPEWLVAVVASAAYTLLLGRTRSLFACVMAHAVTNCALGIYVLATGSFQYW